MEINVHSPTGHKTEFFLEELEMKKLGSVINKLIPTVEESRKTLGFRDKKRLNALEVEFFYEFTDRIISVLKYINDDKKKKEE